MYIKYDESELFEFFLNVSQYLLEMMMGRLDFYV